MPVNLLSIPVFHRLMAGALFGSPLTFVVMRTALDGRDESASISLTSLLTSSAI